MRLDKYLAEAKEGSRSEVKSLISKGFITVNGAVARDPGMKLKEGDDVAVRGRKVAFREHYYYMLNKPAGFVSATRDEKDKTVLDLFPERLRKDLSPVGRLDKDSVGLLLITDDGELAHRLLSPSKHVDKTYLIRTDEPLTVEDVKRFSEGLVLKDGTELKSAKLELDKEDPLCARVTISEGKYHQVKRMTAACGKKVLYLKRLSMGSLVLDETLGEGEYRELTEEERLKL
ncbi:MAG: rRNA pseudouridine synthase [Lachnospiraceae bacterium]|nr:rRNA pseudouridine synthase [Lachnospiraceae bacterium]